MNVNKMLGKLFNAAQPEPHTVEKSINAFKQRKKEEANEGCANALFPHNEASSHLEKKGMLKARNTSVKSLLQYNLLSLRKFVS